VSRNDDEDGEGSEPVDVDEEGARLRPGIRYRPARGGVWLTPPWRRHRQPGRREWSRFFRHNRVPPSRRKPVTSGVSVCSKCAVIEAIHRCAHHRRHRKHRASIMPPGRPASQL